MSDPLAPELVAWMARELGSAVAASQPLAGGLDASTTRCDLADGRRVVLRCLPDPEVAARQPLTTDLAMLRALAGADPVIPVVYASDPEGRVAGCPALVLSWCPGEPDGNPADPVAAAIRVLSVLGDVHNLRADQTPGLPRRTGQSRAPALWPGLRCEPIASALSEAMRDLLPPSDRVLVPIHGDPWAGNLIWSEGMLTGIVDWSDAVLCDPAADIALLRLDAAMLLGTKASREIPGAEHQLFWELWAAATFLANVDTWVPAAQAVGTPFDVAETRRRLRVHGGLLLAEAGNRP